MKWCSLQGKEARLQHGAKSASDSTRNQPFRELEACILNLTTVMSFVLSVIIAFLFSEY